MNLSISVKAAQLDDSEFGDLEGEMYFIFQQESSNDFKRN